MALHYSMTLFVSAILLFTVEPMIGKVMLPKLGGTPAVWNTCMVFFQAALLMGYAYSHLLTRWLSLRRQLMLHTALIFSPLFLLPFKIGEGAFAAVPAEDNPVLWLIGFLVINMGLPFIFVCTSAPLLQKWFSYTAHSDAHDPYFLYSASNLGSMLGLIGYPLLIEQRLTLMQQNRWWSAGYACLALLVAGCAWLLWRSGAASAAVQGEGCAPPIAEQALTRVEHDGVGIFAMFRWVLYSFIPSSLMLAVTTYLSTDISPFPLLWMVPLAIYLLSFILVFARRPVLPPQWMGRVLSLCSVVLLVAFIVAANRPAWVMAVLNLLLLAAAALIYHGQLANDRPPTRRLTEFYLCMSIGGVLGGLFNALVAPMLFHNVLEYPLIIVMACLFRPTCEKSERMQSLAVVQWRDAAWMLGVAAVTAALIFTEQRTGISLGRARTLCLFGLPALVTYRSVGRPVRFGLCLAVLLAAGVLYQGEYSRPLTVERSFFGVLRVNVDKEGRFHQMYHGNTLHGRQYIDRQWQHQPLSYFYPTGPAGELFGVLNGTVAGASVGIIGLGTGSLAAYALPDQEWTYFEIDPAVERIARNPAYFTYLKNSRARSLKAVLGDARLRLKNTPDRQFNLFVVDAFSSDSIPMHLVTREALRIYLDKLADRGVLAFHISNRRLDMRPVLASLASDAGLTALVNEDNRLTSTEVRDGKEESMWVVMGRKNANLAGSYPPPHWQPLLPEPRFAVWTDDFSNIVSVIKWRQ